MPLLARIIRVLRKIAVNAVVGAKLFPRPLRPFALRALGVSCGDSVVMSGLFVDGKETSNVSIGDSCVVNNQVYIDASDRVTIGSRTGLASRINTARRTFGGTVRLIDPRSSPSRISTISASQAASSAIVSVSSASPAWAEPQSGQWSTTIR